MRARGVEAASGEQQIADERIAQVAFKPRNAAETGNQTQPQFGKAKARELVGDDEVADEREFKAAAKTSPKLPCKSPEIVREPSIMLMRISLIDFVD